MSRGRANNIEWKMTEGGLKAFIGGTPIVWFPQPGSQEAFLRCPIEECLQSGPRGTGKTESLLMSFAQYVGKGYGNDWRGILFRRTQPELEDVIEKSLKWFPMIWPKAEWKQQQKTWRWPDGEFLRFRHTERPKDYLKYHGHCLKEGQVLTDHGWIDICDIKIGDQVLSADDQGTLSHKRVARLVKQKYSGDLIQVNSRGRFMEFTPEHKLPTTEGLKPYSELSREVMIRSAGFHWEGTPIESVTIPEVVDNRRGPKNASERTVSGDAFCKFMGLFLSDGWTLDPRFGRKGIGIAGKTDVKKKQTNLVMQEMGIKETLSHPDSVVFHNPHYWNFLRQYRTGSDNCRIPDSIMNASREQLQMFFDHYMSRDGTWQDIRGYAATTSKIMAEQLCEVGIKLGYSSYLTSRQRETKKVIYEIAFNPKKLRKLYTDNRQRNIKHKTKLVQTKRVHHEGHVYCIGVEDNHTFFIRQNGFCWLSGNSFPWIGFEELTNWETDECFKVMLSCCRSAVPGMPHMLRATTNPHGPGANWVRKRYRITTTENMVGPVIRDAKNKAGDIEPPRVVIFSHLYENKILLIADPDYLTRIRAAARNEAELKAWVEGSWDITSGGMFDDLWDEHIHVVPDIPFKDLPRGWLLNRAYDHGQSRPFAVQWWAESNGEPITVAGRRIGEVPGDLILFNEWYGCDEEEDNVGIRMEADNIAQGIKDREYRMGLKGRIRRGPADNQINEKTDGARSVAGLMKKKGIYWDDSIKGPNSRKNGWQLIRNRLTASKPIVNEDGTSIREEPGLFVCPRCYYWLRTVPSLSRSERDLDDVNTKTEDHHGDATRYRLTWKRQLLTRKKF